MRELGAGLRAGLRVLIIGINYRPELTAVGPYTAGLAEHLAARGDQVTVITGLPHYPDWRIARGTPRTPRTLVREETIQGVTVIRAAHYVPATQSVLRRPRAIAASRNSAGGSRASRSAAVTVGIPVASASTTRLPSSGDRTYWQIVSG